MISTSIKFTLGIASDEGEPGPNGDGFYPGSFRDMEGNKLDVSFVKIYKRLKTAKKITEVAVPQDDRWIAK